MPIPCQKDFEIIISVVCKTDIDVLTWTEFNVTPPNAFSMAAGVGAFNIAYSSPNFASGVGLTSDELCNPGAAYDVTFASDWDTTGSVSGPTGNILSATLRWTETGNPGNVVETTSNIDIFNGPFVPFSATISIPAGLNGSLTLLISLNAPTASSISIFNFGNTTLT